MLSMAVQTLSTFAAEAPEEFEEYDDAQDDAEVILKSSKPYRRSIDIIAPAQGAAAEMLQDEQGWFLSDLDDEFMPISYFDGEEKPLVDAFDDVLCWAVQVIAGSAAGFTMLREAMDKDWRVMMDDLHGGEYCIDVDNKLMILDHHCLSAQAFARSPYFRNMMLVSMIKALRDVWQEKRHGGQDEVYRAEYLMLMERVRAADCDVLSVLVGWELRAAEYPELWRHLIGSDNGDMAMVFSNYLERQPTAHFNGQALRAAFTQWFKSAERVKACDHDTLEFMDEVMAFTREGNPFGKKKPVKINIEILSCLPDRTAYLQGFGAEVLSAPLYSAMDDVINQTHLFHILYDLEATIVESVPFRSAELARKIFPESFA